MKQVNPFVLTIVSFECLLGTGTMEWIPVWIRRFQTTCWIPFVLYAALSIVFAFLIFYVARRLDGFSGCTVFDLCLGKRIGAFMNVGLAGAFVIYSARSLSLCAWLIHYAALPYTPGIALILLCLLTSSQLLHGGMDSLLRFQTALYWPALVLAVLLLVVSFKNADFANLLPITIPANTSTVQVFSSSLDLLPGLTLILVYLPIFLQYGISPYRSLICYLWASIGVIALNLLNLIIVLSVFGSFEGASLQWPILEIIRIQKMTGPLLERLDLIFLLTVIVCITSAVNLSTYGAYRILAHYVDLRHRRSVAWLVLGLVLLAVIPGDFDFLDHAYADLFRFFEVLAFGSLPLIWLKRLAHPRNRRDTA
ncbi:GerAB/ArcD/ProY family transporter [Alicyclobacillus acidiphilus]|uniref:GerAB/ArcD/ProY family transporter n=1 Tax=Alicyclobacillus acidiphilus TaxID=182455 RepID=UPI0008326A69|nr:GerAB/ArcD/ProY family transporter [Alicyclobacillus acidiphilus]